MRLEETTAIARSVEQVWGFFEDLDNLPRWDRSVARVERTSGTNGAGMTFDTYAKDDRGRMSYELTELMPPNQYAAVTRSGVFRLAEWRFRLDGIEGGTKVTCISEFSLRLRYIALAPVLRVLGRSAIRRDLGQLRVVIEQTCV